MSKKGLVYYELTLIYKLQNDDDVDKLVGEVENTPSLYPDIDQYTISSSKKYPYLCIIVGLEDVTLEQAFNFSNCVKDYFFLNRIVSLKTFYVENHSAEHVYELFEEVL